MSSRKKESMTKCTRSMYEKWIGIRKQFCTRVQQMLCIFNEKTSVSLLVSYSRSLKKCKTPGLDMEHVQKERQNRSGGIF
jgi:hypothetical protein